MNRIAGIVIAVIGLLVAVLGFAKVLPGATQTGIIVLLLGLLVLGLSFVPKPESDGGDKMSTPSTLINIFFSPAEVFQNLRRHPRWLAAVIIMTLFATAFSNAFIYRLTPERIVNYTIDKTKEMSFLDDKARAQIESGRAASIEENKSLVKRSLQAVTVFTQYVFWIAFLALLFMLFVRALGGNIGYWQTYAAVTYAMFPVSVIRNVLGTLVLFLKNDPSEIHPILGQSAMVQDNLSFLANPATNPVLYTLLGAISLLTFYWIWLMVTGLKNTGEKVSDTAAWTSVLVLWFVGILLMVLMALVFPTFMS